LRESNSAENLPAKEDFCHQLASVVLCIAAMKEHSIILALVAFLALVVGVPQAEANCGAYSGAGGAKYSCCRLPVPLPCCYRSYCRWPVAVYYAPDGPEARAQIFLSRMGYYDGEIDGEIGPVSRRAIRRYQIMSGLPVTGNVDGPLLRSLGIIR
jgi:hypothetical protein